MLNINYANAYKEVLEVLNNLVEHDYEKIPQKYIEFLKKNSNSNYEFKYDISKPFNEQNLSDYAKYILFGLFEKFGATDTQKLKIKSFKTNYINDLEKQKREKYNPEFMFKSNKRNLNSKILDKQKEKFEVIVYKKPKWYQKIIEKISKVLKK